MQHLWLDRDGLAEPDRVKLYDRVQYDGEGFTGFLDRLGIGKVGLLTRIDAQARQEVEGHSYDHNERDYLTSVVQEWLFIGLVMDFFESVGHKIAREELIESVDGVQYLTTATLKQILMTTLCKAVHGEDAAYQIQSYLQTSSESEQIDFERSIYAEARKHAEQSKGIWAAANLHLVEQRLWRNIYTAECSLRFATNSRYDTTCTACWIIMESLIIIASWLFDVDMPQPVQPPFMWYLHSDACKRQALCLSLFSRLVLGCTATDMYISTLLQPVRTQHHDECKSFGPCHAKNLLPAGPLHRTDCDQTCKLEDISPTDMEVLCEALRTDHWGIIVFIDDEPASSRYRMESNQAGRPYIAISHVWAHGLGNAGANALWTCQLLFLKRLLLQVGCQHMGIWLDPLCIPLNSELKIAALMQMHKIYELAHKTIVIDHNLEHQQGSNISNIVHILTSDWRTRIWTLQEALLPAKRLAFLFKDGVFSIQQILTHPQDVASFSASRAVVNVNWEYHLRSMLQRLPEEDDLLTTVSQFHLRSTTRKEDEVICLAILCGIAIDVLPENPQLHHVFDHIHLVPQDIVFARGPRSSALGYGWLPQTFLNTGAPALNRSAQLRVPHDTRGILMKKDVVVFAHDICISMQPIPFRNVVFVKISPTKPSQAVSWVMHVTEDDIRSFTLGQQQQIEAPCLIFEGELAGPACGAIMASNTRTDENGELHASYRFPVIMTDYDETNRLYSYGVPLQLDSIEYSEANHGLSIWLN